MDLLAAAFTGPLFVAALELWVAARTDPELRAALVPLEARIGRELHRLAVALLGADETPAGRPAGRAGHARPAPRARRGQPAHRRPARRDALLAGWKHQLVATKLAEEESAWWNSVTVLADLDGESAEVDGLVADLPPDGWAPPTPAAGWTIAHQIAHLAWTDRGGRCSPSPTRTRSPRTWPGRWPTPTSFVDRGAEEFLDEPPALLARWRAGRAALATRSPACRPAPRSPGTARRCRRRRWPPPGSWRPGPTGWTSPTRSACDPPADRPAAAHRPPGPPDAGLRVRGPRPAGAGRPVRLELTAPDGAQWTFGPADAANRVTGPALDFCLLVTQRAPPRRPRRCVAAGPVADEWLDVAQAFAGPPGAGRDARARAGAASA